jgi:hypothetical protein
MTTDPDGHKALPAPNADFFVATPAGQERASGAAADFDEE